VEGQASLPSPPVRVVAGETSEVELALERGTMVRVVVTDKTEANVRARISVVDAEGREHSGMMSMQDILNRLDSGFSSEEQSVGPLPPGRYTLTATTDDGRSASKRVNLKGKAERKIKLRLR
jgi:membrane carboxypeptidase/penicillin-binding protein PbpC